MRQLCLPFYVPCFPAPERIALSLLGATLHVTEQVLREQHPALDRAPVLGHDHTSLAAATAKLIVDRCAELQALLDFYDAVVDELTQPDDEIPF